MATFRSFPLGLPSDFRYWTELDPTYRVVVEADDFLLHHRLGRDGASPPASPMRLRWHCSLAGLHRSVSRGGRAPLT